MQVVDVADDLNILFLKFWRKAFSYNLFSARFFCQYSCYSLAVSSSHKLLIHKINQSQSYIMTISKKECTTKETKKNSSLKTIIIKPQRATSTKITTQQCWAHCRNGLRCKRIIKTSIEGFPIAIPYCAQHLKYGDGILKVVNHPTVGKCLIARL